MSPITGMLNFKSTNVLKQKKKCNKTKEKVMSVR